MLGVISLLKEQYLFFMKNNFQRRHAKATKGKANQPTPEIINGVISNEQELGVKVLLLGLGKSNELHEVH